VKTCSSCGRDDIDDTIVRCECGALVGGDLQSPVDSQGGELPRRDLALQRQPCPPPYLRAGYEFASKRAEARLTEPLRSSLRQLRIRPKNLGAVMRFMERRLRELKFPRKPKVGVQFAMLGALTAIAAAAFGGCAFIYAWVILCALLVPAGFLVLHISKEISRASKPYAEWKEEEFWPHWATHRRTMRPIPKEIRMIAEEVQTDLPTARLTICHLYEDAFLCARHRGVLGADDELYILEHWGTRDFEE
jgi:hypothetical protein